MKLNMFKKLALSLTLGLSLLTVHADAETIMSDKYDLDLNGTKEWIKLYVDRIDEYVAIPSYMENTTYLQI